MNSLYRPYSFGDIGTTLEKALVENPYDPERGDETAYCRYLRYRVKGFYTKTNSEVKAIWKAWKDMHEYEEFMANSSLHYEKEDE